jgi:N-acetylglucosaminyldiphosphoundecaprenol N-acetyl-beta-D-mannosaminyltransferase
MPKDHTYQILGSRIDPTSYPEATARILAWSSELTARYVCVANVHMVMEAFDSPDFTSIINQADLVTPDGMPLVWSLRALGVHYQQRVYGPDLTLHVVKAASEGQVPVGFYGGDSGTLQKMVIALRASFPELKVAYQYSPPFRPMTSEEDNAIVTDIVLSGVRILFVGLGCPKQERWMFDHRRKLPLVMLGVGAAFDFIGGTKPQSPGWMQRIGLEWLFRFSQEPCRLWRRYLYQNPRFVWFIVRQLLGSKRS